MKKTCIVIKLAGAGFSSSQPRLDDLSYLLDVDKNQSYWASLTAQSPDAWQQQFANPKDPQFHQAEVFPALNGANSIITCQAPLVSLAPPE